MPTADAEQSPVDVGLVVRIQEARERHPERVRNLAREWERGLQGMLGLVGIAGLAGAPLSSGRLAHSTQVIIGLLFGSTLLLTVAALSLAMTAAYGSARTVDAPTSASSAARLEYEQAERGRTELVWGRRLAVSGVVLLAVAIVTAWIGSQAAAKSAVSLETITGVTYCGTLLDAPPRQVGLLTSPEGRVEISATEVQEIASVQGCEAEGG